MNITILTKKKPSRFMTKLREKIKKNRKPINPYNFVNILNLCCLEFKINRSNAMKITYNGRFTRERECCYVRFAVKYFLRANTDLSQEEIGRYFLINGKGMDHSTVHHACSRVINMLHPISGVAEFKQPFCEVEKKLKNQYELFLKRIES